MGGGSAGIASLVRSPGGRNKSSSDIDTRTLGQRAFVARRTTLLAVLASVVGCLSACGRDSSPAPHLVRDSAGVSIVFSPAPEASGEVPRIGSPQLTVGVAGTELNRVVGAVRLSDGRIVVADAGDAVIRYVSPEGTLLRTVGREGDGPGEFRTLQAMGRLAGDTVWAYDFSHHRLTFIAPDGTVARETSLHPPMGPLLAVGVLPDGSVILGEAWSAAGVGEASEPGLSREPVAYVRYAASGELLDTIGLVPGREVLLTSEDGRGVMGPAPFGRAAVHALGGSRLVVGDQIDYELRFYSSEGSLKRIVRWGGDDLAIDRELRAEWRAVRLADVPPEDRERAERELSEAVLPDRRPAYGGILTTEEGGLWVAEFTVEGRAAGAWAVFDGEGRWRGSVAVPDRFEPLQVGDGWVLGVSKGDFDVERVELRPLEAGLR